MTHCLVTGSSGYIGSRLVAALSRSGRQVTATARNLQKLSRFDFPESVQRVELDVADAGSCQRAFAEATAGSCGPVDTAYFLVHSSALASCCFLLVLYSLAISGTSGSSGLGSENSEQMLSSTLLMVVCG